MPQPGQTGTYTGPKSSGLSEKIKRNKMFGAIQKKIKMLSNA